MAERYERNRNAFIAMIVFGLISIPGSFGLRNTAAGWGAVIAIGSLGFMFFITGIVGSIITRIEYKQREKYQEKLQSSRSVKRLSDIEIKRMVDEANVISLEQFEKKRSGEYEFKYIKVTNKPKNTICMISKTIIGKDESVLQCPDCKNYYHTKYLLSWLDKNSGCLVCQFELKVKK